MKGILLMACVFLLKNTAFAQSGIEGFYRGEVTQNNGGLAKKYYMDLSLRLDEDKRVAGESFFQMYKDNDVFVRFDVTGFSQSDRLILEEVNIQYQQVYSYAYFCYKKMVLRLFEQEGRQVLQGTWTSKNCAGSTGKVVLVKEVLF